MLSKITISLLFLLILSSCALAVSCNLTLGEPGTVTIIYNGTFKLEFYPNAVFMADDTLIKLIKERFYGSLIFHRVAVCGQLVNPIVSGIHLFGWLGDVISWIIDLLKQLADIDETIVKILKVIKGIIDWMLEVLIAPDGILERILQLIAWGIFAFLILRRIGKWLSSGDERS
ncbi:MAG: hypothetical protein OXN25_18255 [Candidatus Poribacteria bacterium]|nr:hypothetical protein [Candidatus Poribacteria bacterium]